eukprot:6182815-Pleurochrysis_carterae.AAC.6
MAAASPWLSALLVLLQCVAHTAGLANTAASAYARPQKCARSPCSHASSLILAVQSQAHAVHTLSMRPMLQSQCAAAPGRLAAVRMLAEDPGAPPRDLSCAPAAHLKTFLLYARDLTYPSEDNYYRTLGISEDASYDEIMDAYIALTETYSEDAKRLAVRVHSICLVRCI